MDSTMCICIAFKELRCLRLCTPVLVLTLGITTYMHDSDDGDDDGWMIISMTWRELFS